jgi:type IV pilus assembly protein PilV
MTEVLVSVFVFAFGGIGAATMQILAAQTNLEAKQRSEAVYHANDIVERIRNNAGGLAIYDAPADDQWTIVGGGTEEHPTLNCDAVACTPEQQVAHDLWAWERALDGHDKTGTDAAPSSGLLHPTGCIRNHGSGRIQIAIAWYGRRENTNSNLASGCNVNERYGADARFRRVVRLRTHVRI